MHHHHHQQQLHGLLLHAVKATGRLQQQQQQQLEERNEERDDERDGDERDERDDEYLRLAINENEIHLNPKEQEMIA